MPQRWIANATLLAQDNAQMKTSAVDHTIRRDMIRTSTIRFLSQTCNWCYAIADLLLDIVNFYPPLL